MFTAGVSSTDDEAIDILFGEKTPGADSLIGAKKKPEAAPTTDLDPDDVAAAEAIAAAKKNKPVQQVAEMTDESVVDELFGEAEPKLDAEGKPLPTKAPGKPVEKKPTATTEVEVDYKALYQKMVDDGVWSEVDVKEDTEWNADLFKKVQKLQTEAQYEDLLDKTGPTGKMIIQFEKDGGNPAEILSLFREQRDVQDFDVSDRGGQEEFLRSFYQAQGYSEKSIERTIKALTDQGDEAFKEETDEKKALWDSQYKEAIDSAAKEQKLKAKQLEEDAKNFQKNISGALTSDTEVSPKERKELTNYILNYGQVHNGRQVSQFYVDMLEIQKNPANYVELAKMVRGLKTGDYKKKVADKAAREVSAQSFLKIKNGSALKSPGGTTLDLESPDESSFISLLNRKK